MAAPAPSSVTAAVGLSETTDAGAPAGRSRRRLGLGFWLPVGWVTIIVVSALTAPWLKHVPVIRLQSTSKVSRLQHAYPSLKHWLGTDELGRDMFSRIVWGGRVALSVGFVSVVVAMLVKSGMTQVELAEQLHTSRTQVRRLLDPENTSITLYTLQRAADAAGHRLVLRFEPLRHSARARVRQAA